MEYRALGRTGLKVSNFGLGCMMFGWKTEQAEADRLVAQSLDAGINLFDTSTSYGRGNSERVLGAALRASACRDRIVLCTKVFFRLRDDDVNSGGNHRRHIIAECEASLRRLGTDHVDLLQLHNPDPNVPIDESLRALDDLVRAGKVRYIGTSSFPAWQIVASLWASDRHRLNRVVTEQAGYNLLDRRIETELLPMAASHGVGIIAFSPLAEGILTGKYKRGQGLPPDSRFATVTKPGLYGQRLTDAVFDHLERLEVIAERLRCNLSQLALAWVVSNPAIACVLIGPVGASQLQDNLATRTVISPEDRAEIDTLLPPGEMLSNYRVGDWSAPKFHW